MSDGGKSETFLALRVADGEHGGFNQTVVERRLDELPAGELLVEVDYSSLNYKDALSAQGNRGVTRSYPHTPGVDAAGRVLVDSSGSFQPGDPVLVCGYDLGMNTDGGLAQRIRVPSAWACRCPAGLSLREAMIYGTAGFTAALCLEKLQLLGAQPGDGEVAVTGASGGVGSFSIALLHYLGFSVVALTGKLEHSEKLAALGARRVIDRDTLQELVRKPLAKPQWAHAIDSIGGDYLFSVIKSIQYGGSVAACGLAAAAEFAGNVFPFILRNVNLLGVDSVELPRSQKQRVWDKLAGEWKLPGLDTMAEEISLAQTPEYLTRLYNGHAIGRYLVNLNAT
ncbi:acryloyl-CoA reductase [Exilibacterium tricleocarpae]|uniref:Acryloyl-CoA reductase n=1 Tax=Exilibacterium tricleocarpae TaxID=2591008 RepID=A0A545TVV6_9GAMM|nr:YhdH/YhfP family quinone oxidoreductase [Exilibacterium tricleocarpae]TQV81291.1 acryloyl-CoA reductase [Exilibacterium tricleocarpae]